MADGADGQVLVTGGSGYIGGWCVVRLLDAGHDVRVTIRDLKREAEVRSALTSVAPVAADPKRLTFHAASLEKDAGWAEAVSGCRYVMHVASPVPIAQPKDADELVKPARDGALRVLKAAVDSAVARVVMTSSVAAVGESGRDGLKDESDWTDPDAAGVTAYAKSKTLAERAAREFMKDHHAATSFVTVNPALVLGPVMSADFSSSVQVVSRMLKGQVPGLPRLGFNIVDVRDVADLHYLAMTTPEAADGRFIAAGQFLWMEEVARILRARLGDRATKVPTRKLPDWMVRAVSLFDPGIKSVVGGLSRRREFSAAAAGRVLEWRPRPVEETVVETAESLYANNAV